MRKILVTGGAGFIGSHLCEELIGMGEKVICIDNFNKYYEPKIKEKNIEAIKDKDSFNIYRIDIENQGGMERVFKKERPKKIVHLAARAGVRASFEDTDKYVKTNIVGTANLLEFTKKYQVEQFIFGSSSSVYGERKEVPFKETDVTEDQASPYAITKKLGERLCYIYSKAYNIPITCLRFFTVYGPRGRPDMAPYKFTKAVMQEKGIEIYGNGESRRDYTYVRDIIDGIIRALNIPTQYEIINLGSGNHVSLHEFISIIEEVVGKKSKRKYISKQQGDVTQTYADITKAEKILGWKPKTSLKEGMKRTYQYLKNQEL
ncbi:SDR family NAD(P)-dependent oxidoreductase [Candidatus Woesearchaeota archaeon]|nr:SDR family NAD(P)-dependent oxidoreductase [Candidatus Woesearchaeota archaeon]